jgi:hypothetical protein
VKEHFFSWLNGARPDLLPLYERRFGRRAYQPQDEQARLATLVRALVDETRGRFVPPGSQDLFTGSLTVERRATQHAGMNERPSTQPAQLRLLD